MHGLERAQEGAAAGSHERETGLVGEGPQLGLTRERGLVARAQRSLGVRAVAVAHGQVFCAPEGEGLHARAHRSLKQSVRLQTQDGLVGEAVHDLARQEGLVPCVLEWEERTMKGAVVVQALRNADELGAGAALHVMVEREHWATMRGVGGLEQKD